MADCKLTWNREGEDEFFNKIDQLGGWPPYAKSVVMVHGFSPFNCYFSESREVRDEWNSSVFTSDQYYYWKLSYEAKAKIQDEQRRLLIRQLGG